VQLIERLHEVVKYNLDVIICLPANITRTEVYANYAYKFILL